MRRKKVKIEAKHIIQDSTNAVYVAVLSDFVGIRGEKLIHISWVLVNFAIVQISNLLEFSADFWLLWRDVIGVARAHVVLNRGLRNIG